MKDRFIRKYMRQAKQVGEDGNRCYSRQIGAVIVRVYTDAKGKVLSRILGTGYNSPPSSVPHCDSPDHLREIFWPQLDPVEKAKAVNAADHVSGERLSTSASDPEMCEWVCRQYGNSRVCPRRIVGVPSGKRMELCSCAHAEANAIVNASGELYGAYMFCWCPMPCQECAKLICNAGINKVYCLEGPDYSLGSRFLFARAGVEVIAHQAEWYLEGDQDELCSDSSRRGTQT